MNRRAFVSSLIALPLIGSLAAKLTSHTSASKTKAIVFHPHYLDPETGRVWSERIESIIHIPTNPLVQDYQILRRAGVSRDKVLQAMENDLYNSPSARTEIDALGY